MARVGRILFTAAEIAGAVERIARDIDRTYAGREITLVMALRGGLVFTADLVRQLQLPLRIDYVGASSYHAGTEPGPVRITGGLELDLEHREVLVVDDILDTGRTMRTVRDQILAFDPRSVRICTLLDKPSRRLVPLRPDFVGFEIPNVFVVGYGLDFDQRYRNLPYIAELEES